MIKKILDNKIFRIIYNCIKFFICFILFVYLFFVVYQRFTNNAPLFGYRVFTVASGSMVPIYEVNDVIYVREIDLDDLKVGDDVAYKGNRGGFEGLVITHRIIKIEEDSMGNKRFFTQGVANENVDPSIDGGQILGKVYGKVFFINTLNHVVKDVVGFFFLIFLPLTLVIVMEVLETIIEYKLDNNKIRRISKNEETSYEEIVDVDEERTDSLKDNDEVTIIPSIDEGGEEDEEII